MIVTQKNILYLSDEDKLIVDKLSFHSARLYNSCVYNIRQYYFNNNVYLPFMEQYHQIVSNEHYSTLINDSAQQVVRIVDKTFKSFFSLLKLKNKGKYSAPVHIPRYIDKDTGWSIFIAGRSARIKGNKVYIGLTKKFRDLYGITKKNLILDFPTNLNITTLHQLQIKPTYNGKHYEILFCYEKETTNNKPNYENKLSIDCGLDNLLTCFDVQKGKSFIIDGKPVKSTNHFYNKEKARIQSIYDKDKIHINTGRFIALSKKRHNVINDYFNKTVKTVTDYCIANDIGTLVIGDFKGIKNEINHGAINNQNFVSVPFGRLKQKLESKCMLNGISYNLQEESYTSKCSALDLEVVGYHDKYKGSRVKRGLYKSSKGVSVNADVNGAANILRKYLKCKSGADLSVTDVSGVIDHPVRLNPTKLIHW